MNKNFKLGLAVFAMLLVSAACFADVSPKDKKCEGAWAFSAGEGTLGGFYFKNGNVYLLDYDFSVYYDNDLLPYNKIEVDDDGFYFRGLGKCKIKSVSKTEIVIEVPHCVKAETTTETYKKMNKVPPKAKEEWYAPW